MRRSLAADDLIILPQKRFFVKHFFEKLLNFSELKSFSSFSVLTVSLSGWDPSILLSQDRSVCLNAPLGRFIAFATAKLSASIGSFQGLPAEASEVILLPQRLALKYNTTPPASCQHFLTDFFILFCTHPKTAATRRKNCAAVALQLRRQKRKSPLPELFKYSVFSQGQPDCSGQHGQHSDQANG